MTVFEVIKIIYLIIAFALAVFTNILIREKEKGKDSVIDTLLCLIVGLAWPAIIVAAIVITRGNDGSK